MENPENLIGLDLSVASREVIEILIENASGPDIFEEISRVNQTRHDILELLFNYPDTPDQTKTYISDILHLPVKPAVKAATEKKTREARPQNLLQMIQSLSVEKGYNLR